MFNHNHREIALFNQSINQSMDQSTKFILSCSTKALMEKRSFTNKLKLNITHREKDLLIFPSYKLKFQRFLRSMKMKFISKQVQ